MYVWPAFCQTQSPAASLPACLLAFSGLAPAKRSSSLSLYPATSLMVSERARHNRKVTVLHQFNFYLGAFFITRHIYICIECKKMLTMCDNIISIIITSIICSIIIKSSWEQRKKLLMRRTKVHKTVYYFILRLYSDSKCPIFFLPPLWPPLWYLL